MYQAFNNRVELPSSLSKATLTMQIISIALLFGAINVAGIIVALKMTSDDAVLTTAIDPLVLVTVAIAVITIPVSFILPSILRRQAEPHASVAATLRDDARSPTMDPQSTLSEPEAKMVMVYQTSHIVGSALLEGTSILATILFMVSASAICLGITILTIVLLAMRIVTIGKVSGWMEDSIRHAA